MSSLLQDGDTAVLALPDGERTFTATALREIQAALLHALTLNAAHAELLAQARRAPVFIGGEGQAHIGAWTLVARDGQPVLLRQQMPRQPISLAHIARLSWVDGHWQVTDVTVMKIRGAR